MGANATKLDQLLRAIALTRDIEIDCSTCLDLVPIYVDHELTGADAARELPALHQHLTLCRDCYEEYEALRYLAVQESSGGLPERAELLEQIARRQTGR